MRISSYAAHLDKTLRNICTVATMTTRARD
jgi:hypothetical protein